MTLPASGAISFNNINVELGVAGTTKASLGQASYRTLAGVPTGAITMSNFYGKANQFSFSIASDVANASLATLATSAGWNGSSKLVATINAGVNVYSNSTGSYALTISGAFPGGVSLTNNGTIIGRGGAGGSGAGQNPFPNAAFIAGTVGSGGGPALSVSSTVSITNNGRISGGGGGGGGGRGILVSYGKGQVFSNGSGAGGGIGNGSAGAGGAGVASWGTSPAPNGNAGTLTAEGTGAAGVNYAQVIGGAGGNGGSYAATGGTGGSGSLQGNPLYSSAGPYGGGAGGAAVVGNANITWVAFGTRNGGIS